MQPFCQNPQLSRSLESELESAAKSGELKLQGKNLKDFPRLGDRYKLQDTTLADLSRNKLVEVPTECTNYYSLERLLLYHNIIKSIPDNISSLQSLVYLDISRNQLSYLPSSVCLLQHLQCLVAHNNRLVSLPEEVGEMNKLMELDVSCNEIAHLPVQIGDLANLRSLHLRRNHLQEIPVELTYLQLTFLDLAANRLSCLPVELRFMVTLVELYLEENPLTCPPANLCGRGRVHIFKYLEIQAIKEDKKRGVLSEGEYRRSYRKTSQLNDMRFGGGLSADARRKRNTADSGYGSEQPLDRRWSQEFAHEGGGGGGGEQHTEDARRLAHRAISYRPASHVSHPLIKQGIHPMHSQPAPPPRTSPAHQTSSRLEPRPHPSLTSNGSGSSGVSSLSSGTFVLPSSSSSSSSSPAYPPPVSTSPPSFPPPPSSSSLPPPPSYPASLHSSPNSLPPPPSPDSGTSTSPTASLDLTSLSIQEVKSANDSVDGRWSQEQETKTTTSLPNEAKVQKRATPNNTAGNNNSTNLAPMATPEQVTTNGGDSPEEQEKEERRRTAQRILHKQGSCRPAGRLPLPTSPASRTSGPSSPNSSGLPSPTTREAKAPPVQTYRQFKEQQRLSRQGETNHREAKLSDPGPPSRGSGGGYQPKHSLDIKSVQKEAVMSYMDRVGGVPRAGAPPETSPPPPPTTTSPRRPGSSNLPRAPSASSRVAASRSTSTSQPTQPSLNFTVRREQDRAAVQDTHIHHLRHQIESRLKVSLGEDLAASLTDGVVLCHIANHCSPRSVSSIHVPSPAVPKLSAAKCRRNVDNFLAACRKIGVREDLICSVTDISEPRGSKANTVRVAVTVTELLRHHVPRPTNNSSSNNNNSVV